MYGTCSYLTNSAAICFLRSFSLFCHIHTGIQTTASYPEIQICVHVHHLYTFRFPCPFPYPMIHILNSYPCPYPSFSIRLFPCQFSIFISCPTIYIRHPYPCHFTCPFPYLMNHILKFVSVSMSVTWVHVIFIFCIHFMFWDPYLSSLSLSFSMSLPCPCPLPLLFYFHFISWNPCLYPYPSSVSISIIRIHIHHPDPCHWSLPFLFPIMWIPWWSVKMKSLFFGSAQNPYLTVCPYPFHCIKPWPFPRTGSPDHFHLPFSRIEYHANLKTLNRCCPKNHASMCTAVAGPLPSNCVPRSCVPMHSTVHNCDFHHWTLLSSIFQPFNAIWVQECKIVAVRLLAKTLLWNLYHW